WGLAGHGYVYILHAGRSHRSLFRSCSIIGFAQIDDALHALLRQILEAFVSRLPATVNVLVDLLEVLNAGGCTRKYREANYKQGYTKTAGHRSGILWVEVR